MTDKTRPENSGKVHKMHYGDGSDTNYRGLCGKSRSASQLTSNATEVTCLSCRAMIFGECWK